MLKMREQCVHCRSHLAQEPDRHHQSVAPPMQDRRRIASPLTHYGEGDKERKTKEEDVTNLQHVVIKKKKLNLKFNKKMKHGVDSREEDLSRRR